MSLAKKDPHLEINGAGLGVTLGDWQIGAVPVASTDDRHDMESERRRIERKEDDEHEARRRGEKFPDPLGAFLRHVVSPDPGPTAGPGADPIIDSIHAQIAEKDDPRGA